MPATSSKTRRRTAARFKACPIKCPIYLDVEIQTLSDFFAVFNYLLDPDKLFWFRGHSRRHFSLCPSALRHSDGAKRDIALGLVSDMKRYEMRLPRPPAVENELGWLQVAQHYGLPTRLLDWTQNAAVALYFACCADDDDDGLVAIINPIELNQRATRSIARVLDAQSDAKLIAPYLKLNGETSRRGGYRTIAINPTWNNERISMQQGAFTLHGSEKFELDGKQASSLSYVPILREHKRSLTNQLERVGIGEMFIFPEPEHVCAHLKRSAKL